MMKAFDKILVLENDLDRLPIQIEKYLAKNENVLKEIWYNFNYSFYHNAEANMKRLKEESSHAFFISAPSFIGSDNQFSRYLILFAKLKEIQAQITIGIFFYDGFISHLLDFLSDEQNINKKKANHELLKEILEYHTIYEIDCISKEQVHITWDLLMSYYLEDHRSCRDDVRIKATGEIYPVAYIYYNKKNDIANSEITLYIENDYNNKYKFSELEKICK